MGQHDPAGARAADVGLDHVGAHLDRGRRTPPWSSRGGAGSPRGGRRSVAAAPVTSRASVRPPSRTVASSSARRATVVRPRTNVVDGGGPLVVAAVDDLGPDVGPARMDALEEPRVGIRRGEHGRRARPVVAGEMGADVGGEPRVRRPRALARPPRAVRLRGAPRAGSARRRPSGARASRAARAPMSRHVVSFPPATDTMPPRPRLTTVSRRARMVLDPPAGRTRTPANRDRTSEGARTSAASDRPASARICAASASVAATSAGSPSYGSSVVPRRSIPSHGIANETRPPGSGVVTAAVHPSPPARTRCAPFDRRTLVPAAGSSSRRTRSTHGPAAFTTVRAGDAHRAASEAGPAPRPPRRRRRSRAATRPRRGWRRRRRRPRLPGAPRSQAARRGSGGRGSAPCPARPSVTSGGTRRRAEASEMRPFRPSAKRASAP